jgi:heme A synthase
MSTTVLATPSVSATDPAVRRFGRFALFSAAYTYLLVVFGGLVRITESGLGCGDHWPKCNGRWIPEFTAPTLIEWMHRLLAISFGFVFLALIALALHNRRNPRFKGTSGVAFPIYLIVPLALAQALLGKVIVNNELPTAIIVIHFMTALILMGLLLTSAARAGALGRNVTSSDPRALKYARGAIAAVAVGFVVISFGALTANTLGAPEACQGFPLCNSRLLPAGGSLQHIHWTHRLLAFALLAHIAVVVLRSGRRAPQPLRRAGQFALASVILQIAVAAGLVQMHLPDKMKALHLAVGAGVWGALVVWALLARQLQQTAVSSA